MDQPGKAANPARGQLNRGNKNIMSGRNPPLLGHFLCCPKNVVLFCQKRTDPLSDNCFGLPTSYPGEIYKCSFQDLSGAFDGREQARF